jgi:hypothetical protein
VASQLFATARTVHLSPRHRSKACGQTLFRPTGVEGELWSPEANFGIEMQLLTIPFGQLFVSGTSELLFRKNLVWDIRVIGVHDIVWGVAVYMQLHLTE